MEVMLAIRALVGLLIVAISSLFSTFGGRSNEELAKWHLDFIRNRIWGRVIAPLWFSINVNLLALWAGTWKWPLLLFVPAMMVVSTMGHGGTQLWVKILRRTLNAIVWVSPAIILCFVSGAWTLLILQYVVGVAASLIWGITNPKLAPTEEYFLNVGKIVFMPSMILT